MWAFLVLRMLSTWWGNPFYHFSIQILFFLFALTLLSLSHFPNICLHICHELIISASKLHRLLEQKGDEISSNLMGLHASWVLTFCATVCPSLAIWCKCHQQVMWQEKETTSQAISPVCKIHTMGKIATYPFIHLVTGLFNKSLIHITVCQAFHEVLGIQRRIRHKPVSAACVDQRTKNRDS